MKLTKTDFLVIFFLFIIGFQVAILNNQSKEYDKCRLCETCKLYNREVQFGVNGVYHAPNYYCIWTYNRTMEDINNTVCHEECHDLVCRDYEHFCGNMQSKAYCEYIYFDAIK